MLVLSWNIRGMGAHLKRILIKEQLVKFCLDIVILQETKVSKMNRRIVKSIWSSKHIGWVALDAVGTVGARGILIMWREEVIVVCDAIQGVFSISIHFLIFILTLTSKVG